MQTDTTMLLYSCMLRDPRLSDDAPFWITLKFDVKLCFIEFLGSCCGSSNAGDFPVWMPQDPLGVLPCQIQSASRSSLVNGSGLLADDP